MDEYDKQNRERWTRTAIRRAIYDEARGGFIAQKNTHAGATDYTLLNYQTMDPKIFKSSEKALKASTDKKHGWYH